MANESAAGDRAASWLFELLKLATPTNNHHGRSRVVESLLLQLLVVYSTPTCASAEDSETVLPLLNAHAHNDYWHDRPLHDALAQGFTSVEADVFLRDGQLLVGHEEKELTQDRTLETLYLEPLRSRLRQNRGRIWPGSRFLLFIDIKTDSEPARRQLREILTGYAELVGADRDGVDRPGVVTVVISGSEPRLEIIDGDVRLAGADGRLTDLDSDLSSQAMPVISDRWFSHFTWEGTGPFPDNERSRLRQLARKAHAGGRLLRFWGTPESEPLWGELLEAGVDLINTDELERLSSFLRLRAAAGNQPAD